MVCRKLKFLHGLDYNDSHVIFNHYLQRIRILLSLSHIKLIRPNHFIITDTKFYYIPPPTLSLSLIFLYFENNEKEGIFVSFVVILLLLSLYIFCSNIFTINLVCLINLQ